MNILILSFYFEPDLCAGSFRTTAFVNSLVPKLDREDLVEVITTLPNRYSSFSEDAPAYEERDGVKIHRIALPSHKSGMLDQAKAFLVFARQARLLAKNSPYDLVFATSSRLMTALLGSYLARKKSSKLYLDIRDIFTDTLADVLPKRLSKPAMPVLNLLERFAFSRANKVNLVSEGFKPYFTSRYPKLTYSYLTNGIDHEFIDVAPTTPLVKAAGSTTILYAGNIGEGQGLHKILPPLAQTLQGKNVRFLVIGDGGRKTELEKAVDAAGVSNITITSPVSRIELIQAYQSADVLFLHLNDYDAFLKVLPSKVFEYGALGKPILAGVSGYAADFITENLDNAEIFAPCDAYAALHAFERLSLATSPRPEFIKGFSRNRIMDRMSSDVLATASGRSA